MANPFRTTPSLGPDLREIVKHDKAWYDPAGKGAAGAGQAMSPQTGDTCFGSDGRLYMWAESAGSLSIHASNNTQLAVTDNGASADPRFTFAAGSDGWYIGPQTAYDGGYTAFAAGDRCWIAKGTAP